MTPNAGCSGVPVASSGWLPNTSTAWTVPAGALRDGQDYYWCAKATDYVTRYCCTNESTWSSARLLKVRLPKLGVQSYWPMFQRGPLAVNEATGNLVVNLPGPSFASAAGTIGGGFVYNALDTRPGASSRRRLGRRGWRRSRAAHQKLIDHNLMTGNDQFDAVERVEADGGSSYYTHVAGGNTYQAAAGDPSILAKTTTGFTLTDPDGSIYTFTTAASGTGSCDAAAGRGVLCAERAGGHHLQPRQSGTAIDGDGAGGGDDVADVDVQLGLRGRARLHHRA